MFTPLDLCIRVASETSRALKDRLEGRETWSSVEDAREERSRLLLMISDADPKAFCTVDIDCARIGFGGRRTLIEAIVRMDLEEDERFNLRGFAVEDRMKELWSWFPVITVGTRNSINYTKETGPELKSKLVMEVSIRGFFGDFTIKQLEQLDFDEVGEEIAEGVVVMNAIYAMAQKLPASR